MHRKLKKKPQYRTKNLSKGAKSRVRVFADIQNVTLRARHSLSSALVGKRNHGHATVRNVSFAGLSRVFHKTVPKFEVEVCTTIRVCLPATWQRGAKKIYFLL